MVAYYFPPGNIVEEFQENVGTGDDHVDGVIDNGVRTNGNIAEYGRYGK